MPAAPDRVAPECAACGGALRSLGPIPVRSKGTSGGWIFLFGNLAQMGEKVLHLDTYRRTKCRHLEFYDHDASLPHR